MNIIEAVKTGLPFKRKSWAKFIEANGVIRDTDSKAIFPTLEDLKAQDWEVEEKTYELRVKQMREMCEHYCEFRKKSELDAATVFTQAMYVMGFKE